MQVMSYLLHLSWTSVVPKIAEGMRKRRPTSQRSDGSKMLLSRQSAMFVVVGVGKEGAARRGTSANVKATVKPLLYRRAQGSS